MLRVSLFIFGLLISFCGFLIANENTVPILTTVLYQDIDSLKNGFNKISGDVVKIDEVSERLRVPRYGNLKLDPKDDGFKELSDFIKTDLKKARSEYFRKTWSGTLSFTEFKQRALKDGFSKMEFHGVPGGSPDGVHTLIGNNTINVFLNGSDHESAFFFIFKISEGIKTERRRRTFGYASLLYFLGISIQVLQYVKWTPSERKEKRKG